MERTRAFNNMITMVFYNVSGSIEVVGDVNNEDKSPEPYELTIHLSNILSYDEAVKIADRLNSIYIDGSDKKGRAFEGKLVNKFIVLKSFAPIITGSNKEDKKEE